MRLPVRLLLAVLAALLLAAPALAASPPSRQATAVGKGGSAATVDPVATRAAISALKAGGNAVDAAVAAAGVLGVVEPYSCGVGGGGFMLIYGATKGFAVDQTFFDQTDAAKAIFGDFGATSALYLDKDGTPRDVGTTIRNPSLAKTYRLLAQKGATKGFYSGPVAKAIVATVTKPPLRKGSSREVRPGVMTLDDLKRYRAKERQPTKVQYQGIDVFGMGPPSSGGTTIGEALNILTAIQARPDVGYLGAIPRDRALHFYLEASRYAYADRNQYVGDPSFYPVPTAGLLDRDYAAQRASLIGEQAANPPVVPAGTPPGATTRGAVRVDHVGSTTNMTITDKQGNVVEYTFTI